MKERRLMRYFVKLEVKIKMHKMKVDSNLSSWFYADMQPMRWGVGDCQRE